MMNHVEPEGDDAQHGEDREEDTEQDRDGDQVEVGPAPSCGGSGRRPAPRRAGGRANRPGPPGYMSEVGHSWSPRCVVVRSTMWAPGAAQAQHCGIERPLARRGRRDYPVGEFRREGTGMLWSLVIGRVAGTAVHIHVTFLLFLAGSSPQAPTWRQAAGAVGLASSCCCSPACCARVRPHLHGPRFGVATPDVTLLPIGGVARLERIPEKPRAGTRWSRSPDRRSMW